VKKNNPHNLAYTVGVIMSDIQWIKSKLVDIDNKFLRGQERLVQHASRIQKLEDWKENTEKEWNRSIQKIGVIISIIAIIVSILMSIVTKVLI
jgi:hypothetical protein